MDISLDIIVSALSAAFAGIALIFNGRSMMKKEQREVLKIIRDYQTEITKLDQNPQKPGYSASFLNSSIVGALSFAAFLTAGSPLASFFQLTTDLSIFISRNSFTAL
jgi:hypothetical protein